VSGEVRIATVAENAEVVERLPVLAWKGGEAGQDLRGLIGPLLCGARVIWLEEPYALAPSQFGRLQELLLLARACPTIEVFWLCTDTTGWCAAQQRAVALVQQTMVTHGIRLEVAPRTGLHWRDALIQHDSSAWRVQLDRGLLDYLTRGTASSFSRARRGTGSRQRLALTMPTFLERVTAADRNLFLRQWCGIDVSRLAATMSPARIVRRLRAIQALRRRQQSGQALDPWQARKVEREPVLAAALRVAKSLQPVAPQPSHPASEPGEPADSNPSSSDEDVHAAMVALIKDGQRADPGWNRAWQRLTDLDALRDPSARPVRYLRAFADAQAVRRPGLRGRPWYAHAATQLEHARERSATGATAVHAGTDRAGSAAACVFFDVGDDSDNAGGSSAEEPEELECTGCNEQDAPPRREPASAQGPTGHAETNELGVVLRRRFQASESGGTMLVRAAGAGGADGPGGAARAVAELQAPEPALHCEQGGAAACPSARADCGGEPDGRRLERSRRRRLCGRGREARSRSRRSEAGGARAASAESGHAPHSRGSSARSVCSRLRGQRPPGTRPPPAPRKSSRGRCGPRAAQSRAKGRAATPAPAPGPPRAAPALEGEPFDIVRALAPCGQGGRNGARLPPLRRDHAPGTIRYSFGSFSAGPELILSWPCSLRSRELEVVIGPHKLLVRALGQRAAYAQTWTHRDVRIITGDSGWELADGILCLSLVFIDYPPGDDMTCISAFRALMWPRGARLAA